ncbi:MAG: glycoside hydrolase family 15 protein [Thermoplasmatota archaeon]
MITLLAGNSRILLTVDENGHWTNLYYPFAGQYQHLRAAKVGLFDVASGGFEWLGESDAWTVTQADAHATNAAKTRYARDGLTVELTDLAHANHDLVIRKVRFVNETDAPRRLRLFHYLSLTIAESMYQDTCYWDETRKTINHYKRNYYFQLWGRPDFDAFTCGEHTLKGLRGSYVDAEDGKLEGGRISHGAADSVVQWNVDVPARGEAIVRLLLMMGHSRHDVNSFYAYLAERDAAHLEREAEEFWAHWLRNRKLVVAPDLSTGVKHVYERSVFVLRDCASENGAIIASPDPKTLKSGGDTYNYTWWRDGGYIAKAMDEVGLYENARRFLLFAADCQEDEGYFLHRQFPDGTVGSTWHPPPFIQVDQTATVVSAVWHHFKRHADLDELLEMWPLVKRAANFLETFVDARGLPLPSYDLWEEKKAVNLYSCAAVIHGLERAERISEQLGKGRGRWRAASKKMRDATLHHMWDNERGVFVKSIDPVDRTLDASMLLAIKLGVLEPRDKRAERLVSAIEERLWSKSVGGLARYEGDTYYGVENPWIICTLWLAEAKLMMGDRARCRELLEWAAKSAGPTHLLAEQLDAGTGEHTSVTPLVWSHSTFVDVVNKYGRDGATDATE